MRQELLAQGDELRASLEAATSGIMALASNGGHPGTPAQVQVRDPEVCRSATLKCAGQRP
jgi:hypothetical protein